MQAVLTCMLRSLTVPAIWRHDLGPEFTNALFEEVSVLLGIQERAPPAHRPMAVGMGETVHRSMNALVHRTCSSEWSRVLPLVHYVMMNTPILESGLVPRDLDRAWSLSDHVERELVPFPAPGKLPVDEWAKEVFRNFKLVEGSLSKYLSMTEERRAELYVAELIRVPAQVFDDSTDFERRSLGGDRGGQATGSAPWAERKVWSTVAWCDGPLYQQAADKKELVVGRVVHNIRESTAVTLQPYGGVWSATRVRWTLSSVPV